MYFPRSLQPTISKTLIPFVMCVYFNDEAKPVLHFGVEFPSLLNFWVFPSEKLFSKFPFMVTLLHQTSLDSMTPLTLSKLPPESPRMSLRDVFLTTTLSSFYCNQYA